jgi:hypothetical protein
MLNEKLLKSDLEYKDNVYQANKILGLILTYVLDNPGCTAHDLYCNLDVLDIPLYIALHWLVQAGMLTGPDPYDDDVSSSMKDWSYRKGDGASLPLLLSRTSRALWRRCKEKGLNATALVSTGTPS